MNDREVARNLTAAVRPGLARIVDRMRVGFLLAALTPKRLHSHESTKMGPRIP